jgi:hypothetical protein
MSTTKQATSPDYRTCSGAGSDEVLPSDVLVHGRGGLGEVLEVLQDVEDTLNREAAPAAHDKLLMYPIHLAIQNKSDECCDALLNTRSHTKVIRLYPNVLVAHLSVARKHSEKGGWKRTSCGSKRAEDEG